MGDGSATAVFGRAKLFVSYSHKDTAWLNRFIKVLQPAVHQDRLDPWSDERIETGANWQESIWRALDEAQAALLLVSADFLASEFIINHELPQILDDAQKRGLNLYWVPITPTLVDITALNERQAAWPPDKPLSQLSERDQELAIFKICRDLASKLGQASRVSTSELDELRLAAQRSAPSGIRLGGFVGSGPSSVLFRGQRAGGFCVGVKVLVGSPLRDGASKEVEHHARVAQNLLHPTFIKIYDVQLTSRPHAIITEFVEETVAAGERRPAPTLAQVLQREATPFNVDRVTVVLRKVAEALAEAHEQELVCGLIKPANVLMQDALTPRLSAFGFWTYLAKDANNAGNFLVNREFLSYMTPEQFYGHPVTERSDQYALGLLALEMLEGVRPVTVTCAADFSLKQRFFDEAFNSPRAWEARHPALAQVIRRMLAKEPESRWPSLGDVAMKLARLESEAIVIAKSSYCQLCENKPEFWESFYARLFELAPEVRPLFAKLDMKFQRVSLDRAVQSLLNFSAPSFVEPTVLSATAASHRNLPLESRHYDLFGQVLIETLRQHGATPEVERAWQSTIACGLEYMKLRATQSRPREGSPESRVKLPAATAQPTLT